MKTDGYEDGKFLFFAKLTFLVPVCFGTCLGVLFSSTQRGMKTDGYENGKFLSFEKLSCWYPFVLVPVWVAPN